VRTLAIDLGSRRVGLALSDAGGRLATPHDVLSVSSAQHALDPITALVNREGVKRLVVGLPLNMDGSVGPQARATIAWAGELARRTATAVVFVDERLSSFDAEQQIVARKRGGERITRKRKKAQLDALAAASFLQAFLDGRLRPTQPPHVR
jgi:putative Holliday junction resolvase